MTVEQWPYAQAFQDLRNQMNLSAQNVADATGGRVTRGVIANLESGRKRDLGLGELVLLAEAMKVEPYEIDPRVAPVMSAQIARIRMARGLVDEALKAAEILLTPTQNDATAMKGNAS